MGPKAEPGLQKGAGIYKLAKIIGTNTIDTHAFCPSDKLLWHSVVGRFHPSDDLLRVD